jgi:hypothetical protein
MTAPAMQVDVRPGEADPAQLAAWRRLWTLLLAKGDGATSGELASYDDKGNGQRYDITA